jgi:hypothetical protein
MIPMHNFKYGLATLVLCSLSAAAQAHGESWLRHSVDDSSKGADGVRLADVNGDGLMDIATGWEEGGTTKVYLHPGVGKVKEYWPSVVVGKTTSVEDAVFADLDGDGAMDVVSCCEGREKSVYLHWAPPEPENYLNSNCWKQEPLASSENKMMWMFAAPLQIDGKNGLDLVVGGKGNGATIGWFEAPANPRVSKDWKWHPLQEVGWIMSIVAEDMDADGDADILLTDRKGLHRSCRWLENPGPGPAQEQPWRSHPVGGADREVMFLALADFDGDGLKDVLTCAKEAEVLVFQRLDKTGKAWKETIIPYPENTGSAKAVATGDLDLDGSVDLVTDCEHADPPKSGMVWMSGKDSQWHELSGPDGIKFDRIELIDLDGDGDLDALTCEERHDKKGLGVIWYENPIN